MKALSINQPFAWAILHAGKRVENRTWKAQHRGAFLIHAGLSRNYAAAFGESLPIPERNQSVQIPTEDQLPFGFIVGVATLDDCRPMYKCRGLAWAEGPQCFLLKNVHVFPEPIRYSGRQQFFDVPAAVVAAQLRAVGQPVPEDPPSTVRPLTDRNAEDREERPQ